MTPSENSPVQPAAAEPIAPTVAPVVAVPAPEPLVPAAAPVTAAPPVAPVVSVPVVAQPAPAPVVEERVAPTEPAPAPAVEESVAPAEPAPARSAPQVVPLFTIQVWQLGLIVLGLLFLAGHFVAGTPLPSVAGMGKFKTAFELMAVAGALAVFLVVRKRRQA